MPTTTLPQVTSWTEPPKKKEAERIEFENWLKASYFKMRRTNFKSEVSHSSSSPTAVMQWKKKGGIVCGTLYFRLDVGKTFSTL